MLARWRCSRPPATAKSAADHRLETRWVDSLTGTTVPDTDEVEGDPIGEDRHIMLAQPLIVDRRSARLSAA